MRTWVADTTARGRQRNASAPARSTNMNAHIGVCCAHCMCISMRVLCICPALCNGMSHAPAYNPIEHTQLRPHTQAPLCFVVRRVRRLCVCVCVLVFTRKSGKCAALARNSHTRIDLICNLWTSKHTWANTRLIFCVSLINVYVGAPSLICLDISLFGSCRCCLANFSTAKNACTPCCSNAETGTY